MEASPETAEVGTAPAPAKSDEGMSLADLRKQFINYSSAKADEIEEARQHDCYYNGKQFDKNQVKILKARGQPVITFNFVRKKINGLVGTIRRLRTDPKAFPRTESAGAGAEVATQVVRTVLDTSDFENIETLSVLDAAKTGLGVSEMLLTAGDHGDPDVGVAYVDPRTFFYDPRSVKMDFSDARFMGTYKWVSDDELDEIAPGMSAKLGEGEGDGTYSTAFDTDREFLWSEDEKAGKHRLVDHWYIKGGKWRWCLHVGSTKLDSGDSPFFNEDGKSISKFFAFSCAIDEEGDRYSFIRELRGPQDAINQHRSKAIWIMNTRQVLTRKGAFEDIEKLRREVMRPDGVIEYEGERADFDILTADQEFLQQTSYYQDAVARIEQFGPNQALLGDSTKASSGRALAIQQQAGLAELGPFLQAFRMWKLAQYKAIWCAVQRYWTAERWIRVTDDDKLAGFLQINALGLDEYGQPAITNALGQIDVDIVMDEGPDTETVMGDVFDTMQSLATNGIPVPPAVLLEMSPLPSSSKDKIMKLLTESDPVAEQAKQADLESKQADNQLKLAQAEKAKADAAKAMREATMPPEQPAGPEPIDPLQQQMDWEKHQAELAEKQAKTAKTKAETIQLVRTINEPTPDPEDTHRREIDKIETSERAKAQYAPKPEPKAEKPAKPEADVKGQVDTIEAGLKRLEKTVIALAEKPKAKSKKRVVYKGDEPVGIEVDGVVTPFEMDGAGRIIGV